MPAALPIAIGAASVIGAGASIISGNKAANAERDAANQSDATNRYIYDTTRADYAPYRAVGYGALGKLASMYGVQPSSGSTATNGTSGTDWEAYLKANPDVAGEYGTKVSHAQFATPEDYAAWHYQNYGQAEGRALPASNDNGQFGYSSGDFQTSPGYQFRLQEGLKAIQRSAAARGALGSPATVKAEIRYAGNEASSEYENYANRLAALAGVGQSATGSTAQAGQAYAGQQTQTNMAAGAARASAYANTGSAINQGVGNLASMYLYQKGYGGFGGSSGGGGIGLPGNPSDPRWGLY